MLRLGFALLVLLHGLIHFLGFGKAFGWASPLQQSISRPVGALWAACALLFGAAAALIAIHSRSWWLLAAPALLLSQLLVVLSWSDAKFGTVANVLILCGVLVALAESGNSSFAAAYRKEVGQRLVLTVRNDPIRSEELDHLPPALRRYLEVAGVPGRSRVRNFRARLRGEIRRSLDARWMKFEAAQHNFYDQPARLFYLHSTLFGVPFDALHRYVGADATMQVEVASLFRIVDARGAEMNQSETVTLFNDMCVLAPATLIDPGIGWEQLDARTVKGTFSNAGNTISARLVFNEAGELTNFVSDDRYLSSDGRIYTKLRWSTPVGSYRSFSGTRLASRGEASWRTPSGEFVYARLEILEIDYNVESESRPLARVVKVDR